MPMWRYHAHEEVPCIGCTSATFAPCFSEHLSTPEVLGAKHVSNPECKV